MRWYKYLPHIHARSMIKEGCIKLGMLSGYQDIETHGVAIGDSDENTKTIYSHDPGFKTNVSQLNPFERQFIKSDNEQTSNNISFFNNRFESIKHDTELLAYCASNQFNLETMKKMSEENIRSGNPAYNACVRISDPVGFTQTLCDFLQQEYGFQYEGHGDCNYTGRLIHWRDERNRPAWNLKGKEYAYQKECRIVLAPPPGFTEKSLIVNIPSIKKFLSYKIIIV